MISQTHGSVFDLQVPFYENDLWFQKIPEQLDLFIKERNRVVSATVITVLYYGFGKTVDDYVTNTINVLQKDLTNSFIVIDSLLFFYSHYKSTRDDNVILMFIDDEIIVSFDIVSNYCLKCTYFIQF